MFRMEFQTVDAVTEDEDELSRSYRNDAGRGKGVYEKYRDRTLESRGSRPGVYEGRVGNHGKIQRIASSNEVLPTGAHLPEVLTRSVSAAAASVPKNWVEIDLIDFGSPKEQATVDEDVMRELVKPFAESVNLTHQPGGKSLDADVFVTFLYYQPDQRDLLSGTADFGSFRNDSFPVRSNSMHSSSSMSWSDSSDAEGNSNCYGDRVHIKDEDKGSPAARAYNRAFNKLLFKKNKPAASDSKVAKPWEEPLLAGHEQSKLERKLQKEAKLEAKRQAKQAKRNAENQKRELLDLANPIPQSALRNQKEQYNMRKGIHKLFPISGGLTQKLVDWVDLLNLFWQHLPNYSYEIHSTGQSPKEGDSKLNSPRGGFFETCISPSATDIALSHIRSGPRPATRRDIHFETVESNQRDVEAWTMEEYLAKNSRIPDGSSKKEAEEFGGIEGNQLLNRYFDDDVTDNHDSDSD